MSMEYCRRAALTVAAITLGVIVRGTPAIAASDTQPSHVLRGLPQAAPFRSGRRLVVLNI